MKPGELVKTNKLLLGGTAILSFGALLSGHAAGILAGKFAIDAIAIAGFAGNVLSGMSANNIGELAKKLRENPDILKNDDLAKATGLAIALGIRSFSDRDEFAELRHILRGLADKTVEYWVEMPRETVETQELSPIAETQIRYAFSANAGEFDRVRMLDLDKWEFVVDWLMQQHRRHLPAEVAEYQDAIKAIALHLYETFPKNLREVLKSDAVGEQAFKGMLLDLQRESVSILQQIQGDTSTILAQLQAMPTTEKMFAALAEVNSGIRSDLAEIKQILRQLMQGTAPISAPKKPEQRDAEGNVIPPLGQTYNLPALPPKFLPRPEEIAEIKAKLLGDESQKLVVTGVSRRVGVQGMGGIGKSVLAAAVAQDEQVRRRFPDGVVWITLGQTPEIVRRQQDLAFALTGTRPYFEDAQQGKTELRQLLAEKACLLILDDVWQMPHAAGFDVLGANCQLLLTTRDTGLITGLGAQGHEVGLLSESQALGLLAQWAGEHPETLPPAARDVARECGYLPLAVAISGAMVCDKGANRWDNVLHKLQSADLEKLRQEFPDYPYEDLLKALQVSVEALEPSLALRYLDFAAFPEDTPIPEAVLETFWAAAGLSPYDVQDVVDTLVKRSLAQRDAEGCITLHDLQFDYVRKQAGDISPIQERFLAAYRQRYPQGYHTVEDDGYFYRHSIVHHLHQTNRISEIRELLLDFRWLQAKLDATDVKALLLDFEVAGEEEATPRQQNAIALVESAIRNSAHILEEDKTQLAGQLWGRLLSFVMPPSPPLPHYRYFWEKIPLMGQYLPKYSQTKGAKTTPAPATVPEIEKLLTQAKQWQGKLWFRPLTQSLNPAGGALLRTLTGHSSSVMAVAIAPDGKQAVSASGDKTLKLWDLATGTELATLTGHSNWVMAVAIAPDGKQAVSASDDNTLKLWDLATGTELATLTGHSNSVTAVAIAPDGKQAVSASRDNTLKLWDLATGTELATLTGHSDWVNAVAIAPDGKQAVSASRDNTLKLWDLATGTELATLTGHSDWVNAVAIAPDGKQAVSGSRDNTLKLWDLATGTELATLTGHSNSVTAVAIAPDGKQAVSASDDNTLKLWDLATGTELATLTGHSNSVTAVAIAPDGKQAVSASDDNTLKLWDLATGTELATLTGHSNWVTAVAIAPDGKQAVSASRDNTLKLWDLATGTELATLTGHSNWVTAVAIAPDGKQAVSASRDNTLKLWDLATGTELATLTGHSNWVTAVAIAPDGKQAVSASRDNTLKLWDLATGTELATLTGHSNWVTAVAIAPDGKQAVSASRDNTLKLWDLATGTELATLTGHSNWVTAVAIAPDGKQAVSASRDNTLKLWDLATGTELATLTGHSNWVTAVAIAPDGKQAVSASQDNTLKLWDLATGTELATLTGHSNWVNAVAISPDGKQAVSASWDKTLKLWDLATGEVVANFSADGALLCCAVAPDGVTVVAGERSGRVHFLRLEGV